MRTTSPHPAIEVARAEAARIQRERRDRFAAAALTGLLASGDAKKVCFSDLAADCRNIADCMLKVLDEPVPEVTAEVKS